MAAAGGKRAGSPVWFFNPTSPGSRIRATLGRKRAFLFAIPPVILIGVTVALKLPPPSRPWPRTCSARSGSRWCSR
jgi:hypothetical protein